MEWGSTPHVCKWPLLRRAIVRIIAIALPHCRSMARKPPSPVSLPKRGAMDSFCKERPVAHAPDCIVRSVVRRCRQHASVHR